MGAQNLFPRLGRYLLQQPARPERPMADHIEHQPVLRAAEMKQRLPADVVGQMRQPAAAQRFGHAHVVVAGLGRGAPHLADKTLQFVGESPVLAIEPARVLEQVVVLVVTRQHFLARKVDQPVTHRADFLRQLPCNCGHLLSSERMGIILAAPAGDGPHINAPINRDTRPFSRYSRREITLFRWTAHERAFRSGHSQFDEIRHRPAGAAPGGPDPAARARAATATTSASENQAYCVMVRSQVAHGILKGIDTERGEGDAGRAGRVDRRRSQ